MSGIACIFDLDFEDIEISSNDVKKILKPLSFRGEDKIKHLSKGPASMMQCLFIATKEDEKEDLPSVHKNPNIMIVSDVRLDNRDKLIRSLDIKNTEITDSELIVQAYKHWDADFCKFLNGPFAIIIYDFFKKKLMCFRDQLGLRPLYYCIEKNKLIISSSIKSIKDFSGKNFKICEKRMFDHLLFNCGGKKDTFFEEIYKIPKANLLTFENSDLKIEEYFNLNDFYKKKPKRSKDYSKEFRKIFLEVIQSQMRSPNNKITSALSGGLDSSSITRSLSYLNTNNEINSISLIFKGLQGEEKEKTDEFAYMKSAGHKNFTSNFIEIENIGPISTLETSQKYFDFPVSAINGYAHIPMFKKTNLLGSRVFLDGYDGDTVVSHGSEILFDYAKKFKFSKLFKERKKIDESFGFTPNKWATFKTYFLKQLIPPFMDYYLRTKYRTNNLPGNLFKIFHPKVLKKIKKFKYIKDFFGYYPFKFSKDAKTFHIRSINHPIWEFGIEMIELHALANNVEIRFPFFDLRLIEFCVSLPVEEKNKDGINRAIFRKAMKGIVPKKNLDRLGKSNIANFADKEIRNIDHEKFLISLKSNNILNGLIDLEYFEKVIQKNVIKNNFSNNNDLVRYYLIYSLNFWLENQRKIN